MGLHGAVAATNHPKFLLSIMRTQFALPVVSYLSVSLHAPSVSEHQTRSPVAFGNRTRNMRAANKPVGPVDGLAYPPFSLCGVVTAPPDTRGPPESLTPPSRNPPLASSRYTNRNFYLNVQYSAQCRTETSSDRRRRA